MPDSDNEINPNILVSFTNWLNELDVIFVREIHLRHSDIEDYNWYQEWESDASPQDAFNEWYGKIIEGNF